MQRRGWIPPTANLEKRERSVIEFLGVNSLEAPTSTYHAAKRTSYAEELSPLQEVWCARARHISRHVKVGRYQESHFQNLWVQLKALTHVVEDAERVSEILSRAGIRFVVVEAISGSKIDGACFWLSAHEPVVALSLRYDRHDMFWHTLFHELDHIEHGEGKGDGLIDRDLFKTGDSKPAIEVRANNNAADKLVPNKEILAFIHAANNSYSEHKLVSFAQRMNVHPGIVVGQLQHRDCIPWSSYNFLKSKIRPVLTQHALTDGFGLVIK